MKQKEREIPAAYLESDFDIPVIAHVSFSSFKKFFKVNIHTKHGYRIQQFIQLVAKLGLYWQIKSSQLFYLLRSTVIWVELNDNEIVQFCNIFSRISLS